MSILSTMGLKKIWIAPANTADLAVMPANGYYDLGDVYKDTCSLVDDDPEETIHESETSKKRIVLYGRTITKMTLSLMDPDLNLLARLFGGTVVTDQATTKKSWIKPAKLPYKQWALKTAPEEGLIMNCPDAIIRPKFNITYSAKGICLVEIVITMNAEWQLNEDATDPTLAE